MFSTTQGNIFRHRIMMTWLWKKKTVLFSMGLSQRLLKSTESCSRKFWMKHFMVNYLQLKSTKESTVQQILCDRSAFSLLTSFHLPQKQTILKTGFFSLPKCCTPVLLHESKPSPNKKLTRQSMNISRSSWGLSTLLKTEVSKNDRYATTLYTKWGK